MPRPGPERARALRAGGNTIMARPVSIRQSYTGDRSRLARLELAVEKDPRLTPEQKSSITESIRRLVTLFMELGTLPPLGSRSDGLENGSGRRRRQRAV
jgi:hypothetical protein